MPISKDTEEVEGHRIIDNAAIRELGFKDATIVSFDIPDGDRVKRSTIHRILYGRSETRELNGGIKTYRYLGLLDEGGFRLGQSVFLLPHDLATRLVLKLEELRIEHHHWNVMIQD